MNRLGVVAALAAEARALGPAVQRIGDLASLADGTLFTVSGMGAAAAAQAAARLVAAGATELLSFGLAGGLDPDLAAGTVIVPCEVMSRRGDRCPTSEPWRERLQAAILTQRPVAGGKLLTCAQAIDRVEDKAAAFRETGAAAVDMESLAVAQVAAVHRLPFAAVRVIVDTAADALPRAVMEASRDGQVRIWRLLGGLALAPAELSSLMRLAGRYRTANRSLAAAARAMLPARLEAGARVA